MYSGNFGLGHDVETFLGAAEALCDDDRIRFAFVGGGKRKSEVERAASRKGASATACSRRTSRGKAWRTGGRGDVHLVSLRRGVEGIMVPSKFYGVLAAERPAVFIGGSESEIARVIVGEQCGTVVDPGDVQGLVDALRRYADDPERCVEEGRKGRRSLIERYSRARCCEAWRELLESMSSRSEHLA